MNNVAKQAAGAADQSGPVAQVSPGPSRLGDKTRAEVLEALNSAMKNMAHGKARGADRSWLLEGAVMYAGGWLLADEPQIGEMLIKLVEASKA